MDISKTENIDSPVTETVEELQKKKTEEIVKDILKEPNEKFVDDVIKLAGLEKNKPVSRNFQATYPTSVNTLENKLAMEKYNTEYMDLLDSMVKEHNFRNRLALYGRIGSMKIGETGVLEELVPRWTEEKQRRALEAKPNHTPLQMLSFLDDAAK